MVDYRDFYLKTDVLSLGNVFEKLINTCLEYYGSDPCHCFSSPGLSWDPMLQMTKIDLKLFLILTCIILLKKEWEELFLTLLRHIVKQIINTWQIMTVVNLLFI